MIGYIIDAMIYNICYDIIDPIGYIIYARVYNRF